MSGARAAGPGRLAAEDAAAGRADAGAVNPLTALFGRLAIETRHGGPASGVEVAAAARVIDDLWPAANAGRTVDSRVVAVLDRAVEWGLILQEVAIALAAMIPADRRPEVPRGVVRQTGSDFAPSGRLARWVAAAGDAVERILRRRSSGRPGPSGNIGASPTAGGGSPDGAQAEPGVGRQGAGD